MVARKLFISNGLFILVHVPFTNMEKAGLMTYTAASHQMVIYKLWGAVTWSLFINSLYTDTPTSEREWDPFIPLVSSGSTMGGMRSGSSSSPAWSPVPLNRFRSRKSGTSMAKSAPTETWRKMLTFLFKLQAVQCSRFLTSSSLVGRKKKKFFQSY